MKKIIRLTEDDLTNLVKRVINEGKKEKNTTFIATYLKNKVEIDEKFLEEGNERKLLQKLKKLNLGSGHEKMELSKVDDDEYHFDLITYYGGPTQSVYIVRKD